MSINFCTISNATVDSFCGARRAIVLNRLIHARHAVDPHERKHRVTPKHYNEPQKEVLTPTELGRITVTVEFQNFTGTDHQDVDNRLDLVTITDINVESLGSISVNIEDMRFNA